LTSVRASRYSFQHPASNAEIRIARSCVRDNIVRGQKPGGRWNGMSAPATTQRAVRADARPEPALRRLAILSLIAALYTYALVVFGGIVRITGSGMGCGDDWPRCNGEWIPPFTLETLIEYTHRLLAAGIGLVVVAVLGYAALARRAPGIAGAGGLIRPLGLAAALFIAQALLGAITVWLELPTSVTVAHFVMAMLFITTLIVAAVRGGAFGDGPMPTPDRGAWRLAIATTALGFVVVALGAVTANTPGAPAACMGFPLCSDALLPPAGALPAEIHWAHRLAAFALLLVTLGAAWTMRREPTPARVRRAAIASAILVTAQIGVAAALVLFRLPPALQVLHLAVGAAVWFALATWAALARQSAPPASPQLDRTPAGA
jgi:heme A synthase